MAHETPKAVHFDCFKDGNKLRWNDPVGLRYRWKAALIAKYVDVKDLEQAVSDVNISLDNTGFIVKVGKNVWY